MEYRENFEREQLRMVGINHTARRAMIQALRRSEAGAQGPHGKGDDAGSSAAAKRLMCPPAGSRFQPLVGAHR